MLSKSNLKENLFLPTVLQKTEDQSNESIIPADFENKEKKVEDLEVKDAQLIFHSIWHELEQEVGVENLHFPAEIFWLNGSPGAGKGTQTAFIMEFRDLTEKPIIVSELLNSPEARKKIDAGLLAGDREVTRLGTAQFT
jgi:adenylate kinase